MIEGERGPAAALVHDPAVLDDLGLPRAVSSAAQLAAANARLPPRRAQVAGLRASRRRILEAATRNGDVSSGGSARARRSGSATRRATSPGTALRPYRRCQERIDRTEARLARTLAELRELAHGLHPRVLSETGLAGALASLAEQVPVPVEVVAPSAKLPAEVEAVAYFLCSEALANIAKHASASRVSVSVTTGDGRLRIEVEDDGLGGADPARGTGLRGLADRVEAVGGTSTSRARPAREPASPPRSRSAARQRRPRSVDLRPDRVRAALERVSRVHRRDRIEIEVAFVVDSEREDVVV